MNLFFKLSSTFVVQKKVSIISNTYFWPNDQALIAWLTSLRDYWKSIYQIRNISINMWKDFLTYMVEDFL